MTNRVDKLIEEKSEKFSNYYDLLVEWNEKFNLTAITEKDEVFVKHFRDSLLGERFVPENARVLDIGAGAGFPSLPIKIARPDVRLTMIDSVGKKVTFLQEVISALGLTDASAIHTRAEDIREREGFDCVVSRAVASLSTLSEYCLPFVKVGGIFLAYKADNCEEEVESAKKAIAILGGGRITVVKESLDEETQRSFVIIEKVKATPSRYPRGKNLPRKSPL